MPEQKETELVWVSPLPVPPAGDAVSPEAVQLLAAAAQVRALIHSPFDVYEGPLYERVLARLRAELDEQQFMLAWKRGTILAETDSHLDELLEVIFRALGA